MPVKGTVETSYPPGMRASRFPGLKADTVSSFSCPGWNSRGSDVQRIRLIVADGRPLGELGLLEDMEQVAH